MKTLDQYFIDWESHVFGFGYGTGEKYTLPALKRFLELCPLNEAYPDYGRGYDHQVLEAALTAPVAWLMINTLAGSGVLDYGTSPRGAWLDCRGVRLKTFVQSKTVDDLYDLVMSVDESYTHCGPDYCNCGPNGFEKGRVCPNPFFVDTVKP